MGADGPGAPGTTLVQCAPAKVNLFLHVRGQRSDGYHLLESMAVFPGIGDRLWVESARGLSLSIDGPFRDTLSTGPDNLVLTAATRLSEAHGISAGAALRLEKNLPVASGIGGGSSDAAAALRLLAHLWDAKVPSGLPLSLGADVPVCMDPRPQIMSGVGERLLRLPHLPPAWMVLVNPMRQVSTGAVFGGLATKANPAGPDMPPLSGFADLIGWLGQMRNDLQPPAIAACPEIGDVMDALSTAPLARMSGSGATCFALFENQDQATHCAEDLRIRHPGWWVVSGAMQR